MKAIGFAPEGHKGPRQQGPEGSQGDGPQSNECHGSLCTGIVLGGSFICLLEMCNYVGEIKWIFVVMACFMF